MSAAGTGAPSPHCAAHPQWPAVVSCDRCGVFYCDHCTEKVGKFRRLCSGCAAKPDLFRRDLTTEGHIRAIANFNYVIALFTALALPFIYLQTDLLTTSAIRLPLMVAGLVVFGALPLWLGINLRRYWPAGRAFQLFLAMGLLGIGGVLFFTASGPLRIQGFLLADYNFAILYVLVSSAGSACFTPRYQEVLADSRSGARPKSSSLYVLFVFWVLLTLTMVAKHVRITWI